MIIERVELENFGVIGESIELEFVDGLNVVFGPNEVGKTTLRRAMWYGLTWPPSSRAQEIKDIEPRGGGTPQIAIDLAGEAVRLRVRKRFKKDAATRLTVERGETVEELEGDEADRRLLEELGFGGPSGNIGTPGHEGLWPLTWVRQGEDHRDPGRSLETEGLDQLTEILGGGDSGAPADDHDGLYGRVEEEYATYFTSTGREREAGDSPLHRARERRDDARQRLEALEEKEERYRDDVEQYRQYERELREKADELEDRREELGEMRDRVERVEQLRGDRADCERRRERLEHRGERIEERREDQKERLEVIETLSGELEENREALERAEDRLEAAREEVREAETREEELGGEVDELREERDALRARVRLLEAREELGDLESKLEEATERRDERDRVRAEIESIAVDREALEDLRETRGEIEAAQRELRAMAASVEIEARESVEVEAEGETLTLESGETEAWDLESAAEFGLGEFARVRVEPGGGGDVAERVGELEELRESYRSDLRELEVEGVDEAREAVERREELEERETELSHEIQMATEGEGIERLRERMAVLEREVEQAEERLEEASDAVDPPDGRSACEAEADEVEGRLEELAGELDDVREDAKVARERRRERQNEVERLESDIGNLEQRLEERRERREAFRDEHGAVEELGEELEELAAERTTVEEELAGIDEELDELGAEQIDETIERLEEAVETLEERREELREKRTEVRARLESDDVYDLEERLAEARREYERASDEVAREERRAEARRLLYETFGRVRDEVQSRVRRPLREEVTRLAARVLGFETDEGGVRFDNEFAVDVVHREERGADAFDQLSFGSREQMGIVVRLAVARLIADEEPLPVVLDDVLTSSDPDRFDAMASLLREVAQTVQVVVATCHENRFRRVGEANYIDLEELRRESRQQTVESRQQTAES